MEGKPVFAKEEAIERIGDDEEYLKEMFATVHPQFPETVRKLKAAAAEGQASQVKDLAHSLKSWLGTLGGMRAYSVADIIEARSKSGNLEGVTESITTLENEINSFLKAVKEAFPSLPCKFSQ